MTNLQAFTSTKENWFCFPSLQTIPEDWRQQLFAEQDNPFTSEGFLSALEDSACVGKDSGWLPQYFVHKQDDKMGLMLCYEKSHSYGEYVFDWSWADAYHRNGINYYPKLVAAVPFSPIPCTKWIGNSDIEELDAFAQIQQLVTDKSYSSFHYLFPAHADESMHSASVEPQTWICREGHQFHWFNKNTEGRALGSFEQFLGMMTARKRKNINKERDKVRQAGVETYWRSGADISEAELQAFYHCYHLTYMKRGQSGYLNFEFFTQLCRNLPQQVHVLFCHKQEQIIAAAMYLSASDTLYGRYWGCLQEAEFVHFEACYYQGIELAIARGFTCFNPGTQGEHKIARGFVPTTTYSYHQLTLPPFHTAVNQFCQEEKAHNRAYMSACAERLPFKRRD